MSVNEYRSVDYRPEKLPVSFKYDGKKINGFDNEYFTLVNAVQNMSGGIYKSTRTYIFKDDIEVKTELSYDPSFKAYEWTVWFENKGTSNSKSISALCCADITFSGTNPILKGILGDHQNLYKPYEHDLSQGHVEFASTTGRATHINFPYFMLECDEITYFTAIGWAGTWCASFELDKQGGGNGTHYTAEGVPGLDTYLKPGEKIRTPLMCVLEYVPECGLESGLESGLERGSARDFSAASNYWRRWFIARVMPKDRPDTDLPVQPMITNCLALDTGRPNSDGSISEGYDTWRPSMDKYYDEGLKMDFRWLDAGWYCDANGDTVPSLWWHTVGTWTIDRVKWPGDSLRDSVDYAYARGTRTLMWFEPERVTNVEALVKNYGYNPEWILMQDGDLVINNLGNPECVKWLSDKIINTMDQSGVHMYREDFNCDPANFWHINDERQGSGRCGISENLYIQGHYALWDNILDFCRRNGRAPFADSCASGGGRNDLETMRRAVPLLRSDSDRTSAALRLSMTTSFMNWIPCCGASAKESEDQLAAGAPDIYVLRASYLPVLNYGFEYVHDANLNYDILRQGLREWESIKPYFYNDFYVLTPWHPENVRDTWTAYMFFDASCQSGAILAFRQELCPDSKLTVSLRGLDADRLYSLSDIDSIIPASTIMGSSLLSGFEITAQKKRSAVIIFIKAV